jgi:hypothetical protein
MTQVLYDRDCIIQKKGSAFPVTVSESLVLTGWVGGQGVMWTPSTTDEFLVTTSDGYYAGFMLWGSNESADQFTAMTENQPYYKFATVGCGGWMILTRTYEQYTYLSRKSGGPLVPLVYNASDRLVFSTRGYWTKEITEWVDSGDPALIARGLNTYYLGYVSQVPTATTEYYMGIQVSI